MTRWEIPFLDPAFDATVSVFNRYGQLVYHSVSEVVSWDGKVRGVLQGSGAYVCSVTFKGSNLTLKGTLILDPLAQVCSFSPAPTKTF